MQSPHSENRKGFSLADDEVFPQPQSGVPLASLTTLHVGGAAQWFVRVTSVDHVASAYGWCTERNLPLFVMGGGSNLVIADRGIEGLVVQVGIGGVDFGSDGCNTVMRV